MLNLGLLTIQNLKSFGNKRSQIRLDDHTGLTLIMGSNKDSPDEESRNGCGKSTIFDALAFVLTGKPIKNANPPSALVNRANEKKMLVELDFELNGFECRIIRGLKPGVCRFYKKPKNAPGELIDFDCTKDSIANTSNDIIAFTGIDNEIFKLVLVTAAKQENFFSLDAAKQRNVIEILFGSTILSVKAEVLKEMRKQRETDLALEKAKITERIAQQERDKRRLEALEARCTQWTEQHEASILEHQEQIKALSEIDFEEQESIWRDKSEYDKQHSELKRQLETAQKDVASFEAQVKLPTMNKLRAAEAKVVELKGIDIEDFIKRYETYENTKTEIDATKKDLQTEIKLLNSNLNQFNTDLKTLRKQLEGFTDECPTCGQPWPDAEARQKQIDELNKQIGAKEAEREEANAEIEKTQFDLGELDLIKNEKPTEFANRDLALRASTDLDNARAMVKTLRAELADAEAKEDALEATLTLAKNNLADFEKSSDPTAGKDLLVDSLEELKVLQTELREYEKRLSQLLVEENPHTASYDELKAEISDEVDNSAVIEIEEDIQTHTDLINLLTKKDSPIRKDIAATKLPALNKFIAEYLDALNLPYIVKINDDLTPSIYDFEKDGNFTTVSSGEEERIAMALSWAFRDLFEYMNYPINFFGIDERIDAGLDGSGSSRAIDILYEMATNRKRNIFLISHKQEMIDYVDRVMLLVKENGFSRIEMA
jgi:DNA repair exonuclease SbcCD ATPase subunit